MKQFLFLFLVLTLSLLNAQTEDEFITASGVSFENVSRQQIENLNVLGKVWGFLKYHHPEIANGRYNWDFELFRVMERIGNAPSNENRDKEILKWIERFGAIIECKKCKRASSDSYLKPDHRWIINDGLSSQLQEKLNYIYNNRLTKKAYYIDTTALSNPIFKNENSYENMPYPDMGYRLLSLFRYWNMIQYFYPYRTDMDKDWNIVLKEQIPCFIEPNNELDYEIATIQLIGEVQDTHANLWGGADKYWESIGDNFSPIHTRFIENKLVIAEYYNPEMEEKIGLEIGDIILKINDISVEDVINEKMPLYPASNNAVRLRDISRDILRSTTNFTKLVIQRNGDEFEKTLPLFKAKELNLHYGYPKNKNEISHKLITDNIGYISLKNIKDKDVKVIKETMEDTKGIIIDIRNYPSAFMVFSLGGFLTEKGTAFAKFAKPVIDNPGEFEFTNFVRIGSSEKNRYKGKVVILVNELSQSQAEYTAMAFRASPNSIVIGSTTAGADGDISEILLPGGLKTIISGLGVFYPDGKPTQRVGIIPDIEVSPTIKGIREGRDELIEKAIEIINE